MNKLLCYCHSSTLYWPPVSHKRREKEGRSRQSNPKNRPLLALFTFMLFIAYLLLWTVFFMDEGIFCAWMTVKFSLSLSSFLRQFSFSDLLIFRFFHGQVYRIKILWTLVLCHMCQWTRDECWIILQDIITLKWLLNLKIYTKVSWIMQSLFNESSRKELRNFIDQNWLSIRKRSTKYESESWHFCNLCDWFFIFTFICILVEFVCIFDYIFDDNIWIEWQF